MCYDFKPNFDTLDSEDFVYPLGWKPTVKHDKGYSVGQVVHLTQSCTSTFHENLGHQCLN